MASFSELMALTRVPSPLPAARQFTQLMAEQDALRARQQQRGQLQALAQQLRQPSMQPQALAELATLSPASAAQARAGILVPSERAGRAADQRLALARSLTEAAKLDAPESKFGRQAVDALRPGPRGDFVREAIAAERALLAQRASRPGVQVNVGRDGAMPLAKPVASSVQKDYIGSLELADELAQVDELGDVSDLLTVQGRAAGMAAQASDFLGVDAFGSKERVRRGAELEQRVGKIFNTFRKMITGAAAPEAELRRLEKQILNTSMSPTQFEASIDSLKNATRRAARLRFKLLREGIVGDSEAFAREMNRLWATRDSADSQRDREETFLYLSDAVRSRIAEERPGTTDAELERLVGIEAAKRMRGLGFGQ